MSSRIFHRIVCEQAKTKESELFDANFFPENIKEEGAPEKQRFLEMEQTKILQPK